MECTKTSFESGKTANERCVLIRNEEKEKGNRVVLRPYKCSKCGSYHLTSMSKKQFESKKPKSINERTQIRESRFIEREAEYWTKKYKL